MFRQMLLGSARAVYAPENDEGSEYDDEIDEVEDVDDEDPDEDEAEEEVDDEEVVDEEDEPEPVARSAPAKKSFAQRVNEKAEAKAAEKIRTIEAELNALKTQASRPQGETNAQRQARLAEMEPWERTEYLTNERLNRLEFDGTDRLDRLDFKATCRDDPVAAKLESEVETRLASMRANGFNSTRDAIYTFMLGERAKANKGRAAGRAQRTATTNRDRQTARPSNSRGDAVTTDRRGNSAAARDKRLENQGI